MCENRCTSCDILVCIIVIVRDASDNTDVLAHRMNSTHTLVVASMDLLVTDVRKMLMTALPLLVRTEGRVW